MSPVNSSAQKALNARKDPSAQRKHRLLHRSELREAPGVSRALRQESDDFHHMLAEVHDFYGRYAAETRRCPADRLAEIHRSIRQRGTYEMTAEELKYATQLAWRNNTRCIGRLYWRNLKVNDCRHLTHADDIFEACLRHIREATRGGKLVPMATIFAPQAPGQPGIRIWNSQLIRYAGYRQADGSVIGDPLNADLTDQAVRLGWQPRGGPFDVLPLIIEAAGKAPKLYEIPPQDVLEVHLEHPDLPWFADLGLRWHALPAISDMRFEGGGLQHTATTFSGWYMGTEIGSRNLGDANRYNLLPQIAEKMGLSTRHDRTLWKDRALLELNTAVLHSFRQAGVLIMDHHSATKDFMRFVKKETSEDRTPYAEWAWMVPPMSGSACPVFHEEFVDECVTPNFFYQSAAWTERGTVVRPEAWVRREER